MKRQVLSLDLGSSSGRAILGSFDGVRLEAREVARFYHKPRQSEYGLCWDLDALTNGVKESIHKALQIAGHIDLIGIDTWGVDYVVLDSSGDLVLPARTYRNERTGRHYEDFESDVTPGFAWKNTGIPNQVINTSAQLYADLRGSEAQAFENASHVVMLPDYFAYQLTGNLGWSAAIASTSGLASSGANAWSSEMLERIGADRSWFGDISPERSVIGKCSLSGATVVRSGSHDTAAAVHSLRGVKNGDLFISCGSWTLTGTLVDEPVLSEEARLFGLTNEVRVDGGIRLLSNGTGLWVLQQAHAQWLESDSSLGINQIESEAADAQSSGWRFDPNDPEYAQPGNMVDRVVEAAHRDGVELATRGQIARAILESVALSQAKAIEGVSKIVPTSKTIRMVGGGVRDQLLSQLIADACKRVVETHSPEGSALGSLVAQLETIGDLDPDESEAVVSNLETKRVYTPRNF